MALDLYVGPLCRYHAGDWKNVDQRMAEAQGLEYTLITPNPPQSVASPDTIARVLDGWKDWLGASIRENDAEFEPWRDEPDLDYATDRPGWEGFSGLVHKCAYLLTPELTPPLTPPEFTRIGSDPAYLRATREPSLLMVLADCGL